MTRIWGFLIAFGVLGLSFILPFIHPGMTSGNDLVSVWALAAYWLSESAGPTGMPLWVIPVIFILMKNSTKNLKKRIFWTLSALGGLILFLAGGAAFNENLIKPAFSSPRPNIVELSDLGKLSIEQFYKLPDKKTRSAFLENILNENFDTFKMDERIRRHWIRETGFSFPSGHSFASMMFASFCIVWALRRKLNLVPWYFLLGWAVLVGLSRCILRVHWPLDVFAGALEGFLIGSGCSFLLFSLLKVNKEDIVPTSTAGS